MTNKTNAPGVGELWKKLQALDAVFVERLPARLQSIREAMDAATQDSTNTEALEKLHRELHTLAGSAGTFGFPELTRRTREVEYLLKPVLENEAAERADLSSVANAVDELLTWARKNPGAQPETRQNLPQQEPSGQVERLIYLVDDDRLLAEGIAVQLEYFGYEVEILACPEQLASAVTQRQPSAIIMDMDFPKGRLSGSAQLLKLTEDTGIHFPTLFISGNNSFEARLSAVRAGADDYLTKPVDVVSLTERLDKLTSQRELHPYRILIVDDDATTAEYYAHILRSVGMEVRLLHEPQFILKVLAEFRPELVLMDVYMPTCSGIELAKVMRQDNRYLDIPIVFLSSETNLGKQLDAIESGADDFLTKPIKPKHLISSLSSRAARYTSLRSLILRDSLTGLLNHSAIKDNLLRELSRAKREGKVLSLAMIDIDLFKHVNDTYGHPMGDQVIRALSRLLQQRLRRADLIGRYGGEEFAVIFPSTPATVAGAVLNKVREAFSKIVHHAETGSFTVNFSAGVVDCSQFQDGDSMFSAADAALYRAKESGRNRVEVG